CWQSRGGTNKPGHRPSLAIADWLHFSAIVQLTPYIPSIGTPLASTGNARFTPHVFDFPWRDDFAAARNEALRRASGDWIFWLDADDRLTAENVARLRLLLDSLDDRPRAYMMQTVCATQ